MHTTVQTRQMANADVSAPHKMIKTSPGWQRPSVKKALLRNQNLAKELPINLILQKVLLFSALND